MLISVKLNNQDGGKIPEWAIVELQGTVQVKQGEQLANNIVGNLHYSAKKLQPTLVLGHHVLTGKEITLEKPMAVIVKHFESDKLSYNVTALIKKKILFKARPKPIISNACV